MSVQVANVRFGYAGDVLFEGVTFSLGPGERASLVAPNGAGKSTLLRVVAGEVAPDDGTVQIPKHVKLSFYRQSHEHRAEGDVMTALLSGFGDIVSLRRELEVARSEAASGTPEVLAHLASLEDRYHVQGGDGLEHKVAAIATKLGFSDADLLRPVVSLSGGERGRLELGVALAQEPDLLLLDEPTNHLDLDTISWLEGYLRGFRGALLVVSHDREFLDAATTQTLELGRRGLRVYHASYSRYLELREEDLERERGLAERQRDMVAKTEDFIRRNIGSQKTKQAQSRRKMLDKLERIDGPEDVWQVAEKVAFRFAPAARSGDIVIEAQGLGADRGGRTLFDGLELLLRRGDRLGIVGTNGSGKTTLLRILAGRAEGQGDRGKVRRGTNLQEGYYDQHLGDLTPKHSAIDEIRSVRGDFTGEAARQYLARFRFYGDDPLRQVSGFSGGERSRLALGKLLLEPKNVLFLDEPTNHLDIPAAEILEEALCNFEGTIVLVSHDRRFLANVTTRLLVVRDGTAELMPGGYRDWVEQGGGFGEPKRPRQSEAAKSVKAAKTAKAESKAPPAAPAPTAVEGKNRYSADKSAQREVEKKKRRVAELEKLIESGESQIAALKEQLRAAPGGDWERLAKMAAEERALAERVDTMMKEWTRLSEEIS